MTFVSQFDRYFRLTLSTVALSAMLGAPSPAAASTAGEINASVDAALARLEEQIPDSKGVLEKASGVLVFPGVVKAGFIIAGEGGEGALRIGGKTKAYYSIISGSVGLQAGAQKRDIIMVFLDAGALKQFEDSKGWKAGADATVTMVDVGASGAIYSATLNKPIVAFVVGQKGLMAGMSLDGSKISKLDR